MNQQKSSFLLLHPSYLEHHLYATRAAWQPHHLEMVKNAECEEKNFNLIQNFGEKQLVQKSLKKQQSSQFIKKERKLFEEK